MISNGYQLDRPAFVTFLTAGYPTPTETVESLLALQRGGADVIELGKDLKKKIVLVGGFF